MPHLDVQPVTRDCRCVSRPSGTHTPTCESEYRNKFFASWTLVRQQFYWPEQMRADGPADHGPGRYGAA